MVKAAQQAAPKGLEKGRESVLTQFGPQARRASSRRMAARAKVPVHGVSSSMQQMES